MGAVVEGLNDLDGVELLTLHELRCPNCGKPPGYRVTVDQRTLSYAYEDPEEIVGSLQCDVSWCRTKFIVRARHFQEAG
jgi:hypothetical protein